MTRFGLVPHPPLEFDSRGAPLSSLYGDIFRSRAGAISESHQVFVQGAHIIERWRDRSLFTILEIGFGLGVNTLATLAAWRQDKQRPARLHIVSIEKHPLSTADLVRAHHALGLDGHDAEHLRSAWPPATPDLHRIEFEHGAVSLWLAFGDARQWLPQLRLAADAIYLDGFAPSRNPEPWDPQLIRGLARFARRGTRVATYSAARSVRDGLIAAGFEVSLQPGFGTKRERTEAVYAPRWPTWPEPPALPVRDSKTALIVGGGLAGTAVAARLCELGWSVRLIEQSEGLMQGGSGQPVCADHLHVSSDDNLTARATRAALLLARTARMGLGAEFLSSPIGRLQLAVDLAEEESMRQAVARLALPTAVVDWVDGRRASEIAGTLLPRGGLWLPGCDALAPDVLARARIAACGDALGLVTGRRVDRLVRRGEIWQAIDPSGHVVAEGVVAILCNAGDVLRLGGMTSIELRRIRGQTTWLQPNPLPGLRVILGGPAYAVRRGERLLIGASFDESGHASPDQASDLGNLRRFGRMIGANESDWHTGVSSAAVGFRWTAIDRLPLIGAIPDEGESVRQAESLLRNAKLGLPRQPDLYCAAGFGSRGSLWSELAAQWIASAIEGAPCPVPADLGEAMDPARHIRPWLRRRSVGVAR